MILPASRKNVVYAVDFLRNGQLVVLPTETVYGLAADATNGIAVAEIFSIKKRPGFNPLIVHVSGLAMSERYAIIDPLSHKLMERFWPGPLTLILSLREKSEIHPLVTAGLTTIALRNPKGIFFDIIKEYGLPLAAPSANLSGRMSATTVYAVEDSLARKVPLILDGGPCSVGIESTIIKVSGKEVFLLRPGGLARTEIEEVLARKIQQLDRPAEIESPGLLGRHYAPNTKLRLNAMELYDREALLAFGPSRIESAEKAIALLNLSPSGDLKEASACLFDYLHKLDKVNADCIAVQRVPMEGLGEAINDRLIRAAFLC
ncbi:MAG: L-threonylcarbamoyladenylate synthase [Candidatus Tokpelaia sp. JSC161]|jgi:L-threonylcarbamoyladenylate synthase|nr:MAG: L-threonylcarbamoyladenylate synthase [Candidatus Tokpelaia sp. JSC161]